ncbi:hypothetical protein BOW53_13080 [Solemya pervernicosa gill symbiont]|uniref:Uncharacterized protein n=2 Tax=Gammaproteobacteria incertae sedis TaxID=118884 RepID=A0A1T2L1W2_9GAMM|nr:hypothetical protein BOW53_13080 [Solemya pervernicosa gill symbiont]
MTVEQRFIECNRDFRRLTTAIRSIFFTDIESPIKENKELIMSTVAELQTLPGGNLAEEIASLRSELEEVKLRTPQDKVSIILLSGDFDKAMAAFMMANGAAA